MTSLILRYVVDFQVSVIGSVRSSFAREVARGGIPPHMKRVATLPCEILIFKKTDAPNSRQQGLLGCWSTRVCLEHPAGRNAITDDFLSTSESLAFHTILF